MVEANPSSDMDELFDFSAPQTVVNSAAYPSRRSLRETSAAASAPMTESAIVTESPIVTPPIIMSTQPHAGERRAALRSPQSSGPSRLARTSGSAVVARRAAPAVGSNSQPPLAKARPGAANAKPRAAEAQPVAANAKPRKNPLSVLVTMATVGGMFAVFGLPAYAMTDPASDNPELLTASASQSIVVSEAVAGAATSRDTFGATSVEQLNDLRRNAQLAAANAEYLASGAQQMGDDYPWPLEGYGLSPLNYYYRQCTDFVAWRLNRDAGATSAPFAYVWSNLTPGGGDASQWRWAWENKGWTVSSTPVVGAVAWFNGNHVSYVKSVLPGNKVLIEEYNYNYSRNYGQRTLKWDEVAAFLYPPGT